MTESKDTDEPAINSLFPALARAAEKEVLNHLTAPLFNAGIRHAMDRMYVGWRNAKLAGETEKENQFDAAIKALEAEFLS